MADGGVGEAGLAAWLAEMLASAGPAVTYGGLAAEGGAGAGAGLLGAGAAAGGGAMTAAEAAAMEQAAQDAAAYGLGSAGASTAPYVADAAITGAELPYAANGGLLGDPSSALAADKTGNAFATDYDKYKFAAQQGFRNLGNAYNKLPPGVASMATQGLLGERGTPPPQTNIRPPSGGGGGPVPNSNPYGGRVLPKASPYAPVNFGGQDAEEMKRRLMLLLRGGTA